MGADFKFALLWSDVLIYFLVLSVVGFFVLLRSKPQTRKSWLQVFESRIGIASFMVMCLYIFIALLDSIHFREALPPVEGSTEVHYSNNVESVLDLILVDLKDNHEKTYSAPFALYSFAKENMTDEQGRLYRDFPRLRYGGAHLDSIEERGEDILLRSLHAVGLGVLFAFVAIVLVQLARKRWLPDLALPWGTVYLVLLLICVVVVWVLELGAYYHIMGTDKVGTDVLYQSIKSIRTGVLIGTLATVLALPFAIGLGISAGYFKGWVDDVVQYIYTTLSSIPDILLIAAAVLVIDVYIETRAEQFELLIQRADFKFLALCLIFGLTSWTGLCRLLRAETLKVSQLDYVEAARAFGVSHSGIILRHILPNVMHLVIISLVLNFSTFVLAESILSYIGVGVDASMNSWGNMINTARQELSRDPTVWWSILSAFILMFVLVLAANLFSDKVRDAFDPRTVAGGRS